MNRITLKQQQELSMHMSQPIPLYLRATNNYCTTTSTSSARFKIQEDARRAREGGEVLDVIFYCKKDNRMNHAQRKEQHVRHIA